VLIDLLFRLRGAGVPVSITEYLAALDGLNQGVVNSSVDEFYLFARLALIKDERYFDRFDRIFSEYITGVEQVFAEVFGDIPEEWLRRELEKHFTDEEKQQIESLGGFDEIMQTLRERMQEQTERHEGGNKWIGTGGTSPFGADGYNPAAASHAKVPPTNSI